MEKSYPFKADVAGGIGGTLCDSSWDMRREQSRDSERDKSEVEHGGHSLRAGRTALRIMLAKTRLFMSGSTSLK